MINISFSFTFTDLPFYFIPRFVWTNKNNFKSLTIYWLTGEFRIDNNPKSFVQMDVCHRTTYWIITDSITKAWEIMDIIEKSPTVFDNSEAMEEYVISHGINKMEKDENGLHIVCDIPGLNEWKQNQLKNELTRRCLEYQEREGLK